MEFLDGERFRTAQFGKLRHIRHIGNFGKNGQTGLLLSFAALSVIFCVSRFTNAISRWRES
jgi:hypothetical protein